MADIYTHNYSEYILFCQWHFRDNADVDMDFYGKRLGAEWRRSRNMA